MTLDLSSFAKALQSLKEAVNESESEIFMSGLTPVQQNLIRAGVVQNFEFTFELSWKFIQRWIRLNRFPEDAEPRSRKDLFRMAARYGLIKDPVPWFRYSEARNLTSNTYDESKAKEVYDTAVRFCVDANALLSELQATND